jgi:hypothetical protein
MEVGPPRKGGGAIPDTHSFPLIERICEMIHPS